ncbi:bifunctional serine/threonine-protein kinase/formylglycine-generating enzyme family protein [Frigoriglobus tundricola]|uniref:non-specific serine/threonine protein kinase n=1 Tax=Frigoriglobus tundricola TaxID=2774151 RepID=A0A6M5YU55_9BACT|nr:bifunctional serine/threonine-protein kinase/formylglycine-generating enzyme family protein [Frigoriglobus tundricola]QJW96946.1 hypothetical protein FTUN_4506 [Frigoriglobus tundricola]
MSESNISDGGAPPGSGVAQPDHAEQKTEVIHPTAPQPAVPAVPLGSHAPPHAPALGHFDILETIGRGGFGVVVKAFDRNLRRVVAIKMMPAELAATSPARRRFVREARAAAAVRHENVVCIHAVEEHPVPHLVMEYVSGGSLQRHLDGSGPLDPREVLRIGAQIARGLAAAHDTGLVHRDIKPANVLLEPGAAPRVKLTDFGIAQAADDASQTQSGTVVGTPMYMAPEQAKGARVDHRADLFSLGSVLYTMVSGRPPFRATNSLAVLKRVANDTPRPVQEIVPETPRWLCDIVAKLHARDPDDRFQSAAEVANLMETYLAVLEGSGVPEVPPRRNRWRKRWPGVALVGTGLALGALAAGSVWPAPTAATSAAVGAGHALVTPEPLPPKFTNALGIEFVLVPAGAARLGGGDGFAGAELATIDRDFYLGTYEVTQEEWDKVMGPGRNPSRFTRTGAAKDAVAAVPDEALKRFPVEGVTWPEAQEFVRRLNQRVTEPGWVYRLPRSAEWEYACRGGPNRPVAELGQDFYLAAPARELGAHQANVQATGLRRPCPVGSYPPNRLGLHDMHGNAFELCDDLVLTAGGWQCAIRGGFWRDAPEACRARTRPNAWAEARYEGAGFRLARVPAPECTRVYDPDLAPDQQVDVFSTELRRLNPDLLAPIVPTITGGRVTGLAIDDAKPLRDLSPVRLLPHLESVRIWDSSVTDLSPLKGLPLRELVLNNDLVLSDLGPLRGMRLEKLEVWGFQGTDLSPLEGMPLRVLTCGGMGTKLDIAPLRGLPLRSVCLSSTEVEDLSPLNGAELDTLVIKNTRVRDLTPIRGSQLARVSVDGSPVTDLTVLRGMPLVAIELDVRSDQDLEFLRSFPMLASINTKPAAEFWRDREKK